MADEEKEEKTYEVKDKRRVNSDGTLREPQEAPAPEPEAQTAEPEAQAPDAPPEEHEHPHEIPEGLPVPTVYDLMELIVGMLSEQAWQRMGIRLAPGMGEVEKDLGQAKIAIDTIVFIADAISPHVGEEDRKALRGLVSDLQINFVRQS